jgi:hypothetical protein
MAFSSFWSSAVVCDTFASVRCGQYSRLRRLRRKEVGQRNSATHFRAKGHLQEAALGIDLPSDSIDLDRDPFCSAPAHFDRNGHRKTAAFPALHFRAICTHRALLDRHGFLFVAGLSGSFGIFVCLIAERARK